MTYLTDAQIDQMSEAAVSSYELSCSWRDAGRAAREHAMDEYGIRANDSAVGLAVRRAQVKWEGYRMASRRADSQ